MFQTLLHCYPELVVAEHTSNNKKISCFTKYLEGRGVVAVLVVVL